MHKASLSLHFAYIYRNDDLRMDWVHVKQMSVNMRILLPQRRRKNS